MVNSVTIVGNVTDEPELRYTAAGKPVVNLTVAVSTRHKKNGQWEDALQGYFRCNCWGPTAEHVAESVGKGTRVVVTGSIKKRSWEDGGGNRRSAFEIEAQDVGLSLRFAPATSRPARSEAPAPAGPVAEGGF